MATDLQKLAMTILDIQYYDDKAVSTKSTLDRDAFYERRAIGIYQSIVLAISCGMNAGIRIDPDEPEWPVAIIELPTGQVSWHLQAHEKKWDGHTTEEKYVRMIRFAASALRDEPGTLRLG